MRCVAVGAAAAIALPALAAGADAPAVLTLETAARRAIAWHPALLAAAGNLAARGEDVAAARTAYGPQVSAGVASGYDSRVATGWRPRPQLGATQMLFDFGKTAATVDAARAGERGGRAEMLLAVDTLVRETGQAVVEIQRAAALARVAEDQRARVGEISRLVRDRYETGGTTQSDALQAEARVEAAKAALIRIEAEGARWRGNLAYLLGEPALAAPVAPDAPDWLEGACTRAGPPDEPPPPAVAVAEAQAARAAAELRRSRADLYPTLSVGGDAVPDLVSPLGSGSIYSVGLRVTGNVLGGGRRARLRGAGFALAAATAEVDRARNEAGQRFAEARRQIDGLTRILSSLAVREARMRDTGRLYRLQYLEMGTRTLVDLLNAEQELQQVRMDAVNAEHDLRRLRLDCLFHSGRIRAAYGLAGASVQGVTL